MFFFLCFAVSLSALDTESLSINLDTAVNLALDNSLNLQKSEIDIASSAYSEQNLWSEIFPTISAFANAGFRSPLLSGTGFEINDNSLTYGFGFGINLGLNAGIPYSMRSIRLAHQLNILRYEDARNQLSIQITKMFYSLIAEKNNLLVLEEVLNLARLQYERNQISFRNGLIRELSLIQSRLAVENARFNYSAANISYTNNMGEFLALLGLDRNINITLEGEINVVRIEADAEALINEYLPSRPDIIRARQEIERLENAERQIAMQNRAPSLTLSLDWSSSKFDPFTDTFSGSARVNIPIDPWVPGSSRNRSVRSAGEAVEKARMDLEIAIESAKTQIRSLSALLRNSWNSLEIARLSLEASEHSYRLTEQGFRGGTVESLVLEDARNNLASARQRVLSSELAYLNMILDLSAAVNIDWKNLILIYGAAQ